MMTRINEMYEIVDLIGTQLFERLIVRRWRWDWANTAVANVSAWLCKTLIASNPLDNVVTLRHLRCDWAD